MFVILERRYVGGFYAEALGKEKKCHSAVATALEVLKTQSLLLAPRGKESHAVKELFFGEIGKIIVYKDFLHTCRMVNQSMTEAALMETKSAMGILIHTPSSPQ